ncbi:hypothetical protein FSP39_002835 [Pinctada imbricata]|uniref:Pachytene checkpoint protein 2 homolog n=1 Tax=Pinctada imbricata TaxID=66713 RepID=A0AA88XQ61_PINIB|nr:hypothetical protein FSP39_002835 [Pinctada imbricata]
MRRVTVLTPIASRDRCLFCSCGNSVTVFSTVSGECIRKLVGHRNLVTSVYVNPRNKLQVLTSSLDQTILIWDYQDGIVLKEYRLHFPIVSILAVFKEELFVLCNTGRHKYDVLKYTPQTNTTSTILRNVSGDPKHVAISLQDKSICAINGKSLSTVKAGEKVHSQQADQILTCVAMHPTNNCVVTGTQDGKIYYWWNLWSSKKTVKSTDHWHSLPVQCLKFTAEGKLIYTPYLFTVEGSYLLSGGHECVLVKWQFDNNNREYLPRLGAPLCYITCSPDNQMYATCHHDNVVNLISNKFKLLQVYQGLTVGHLVHQKRIPTPCGLLHDPRTKAMVTNGKPGHLQFYLVDSDKQLYNLDIVCENYISPENLKRPTVVTEVTNAAFSSNGHWLVTLQLWDNGVMSPEMILKFWFYNEETQSFMLNTMVDTPHSAPVNSLKFRPYNPEIPASPMVVTSSQDGKFKCWVLTDDTDIYRENSKWMCESVGYYRDREGGVASFTEDGSLLAVVFGSVITLWNPDNNILRRTLSASPEASNINHIEFGHGTCCHYLVACSKDQLVVWDLRSCSVSWSVDLNVSLLLSDPQTDNMAIITSDHTLYIFQPSNPEPSYTHKSLCDDKVVCGVFIPHFGKKEYKGTQLQWQSQSQLYLLMAKQKLLTLLFEEEVKDDKSYQQMKLTPSLPQTPFSLLMSKERKTGVSATDRHSQDAVPSGQFTQELIMAAPHTQPNVSLLCNKFIQSLLIRNRKNGNKDDDKDDEDEEEEDSDDKSHSDSDSDMEVDSKVTGRQRGTQDAKTDSHDATGNIVSPSDNFLCSEGQNLQEDYLEKALSQTEYIGSQLERLYKPESLAEHCTELAECSLYILPDHMAVTELTANDKVIKDRVTSLLQRQRVAAYGDFKLTEFDDDFLKNHVVSISLCDTDIAGPNKKGIDLTDGNIQLHVFQLQNDGPGTEELDDEDLAAASHWILPAGEFSGIWESLVFDDEVKHRLLNYATTTLLFSDRQVDNTIITWNKVILLHGPPGTGKTSLCKALAQKLVIRLSSRYKYGQLIEINSHSLCSKWFSESGKLVMKMFQKIQELIDDPDALVFVLIDEVESLTAARKSSMSGSDPSDAIRVVNALLTQLDQIKRFPNVMILTTSNVTGAIDLAFVDRADIKQYIGPPSPEAIFKIYHSCIQELMRVGIIFPEEQIFDLRALTVMRFIENDATRNSLQLREISRQSYGLSGRSLRKLPFIAHAMYLQSAQIPLTRFLDSLNKAVQRQFQEREDLTKDS